MKILGITDESQNDFSATLICEHCGNKHELQSGYHDNHYHTKVIPEITCKTCGMNRAGEIPEKSNDNGMSHKS